jgi:cell fate regulator YaaT (PSP1 superfamily)
MSIVPLPVFEADADPHHRNPDGDAALYDALKPPDSIVVKFGRMGFIGEYRHDGDAKPGCGSKLVARTHRGTELVEMLTTTCSNAGCAKSITRQEMLDYIEQSGGRDFPFYEKGKILRVATIDDLNKWSAVKSNHPQYVSTCNQTIGELGLPMKLIDVEPILGEELLTFYFLAEERIDFRELVQRLASEFHTRIEMRQVGARDEARLVADYERCGQYCCCKNFLKVLKPVSMRAAKVQKATLDPLKISGRCGRLMCCLRYEDATYKELKANLPRKRTRVGTTEGPGIVVDTRLLVQLVLVKLEHNDEEIAVPVEELLDPDNCPSPEDVAARKRAEAAIDPLRGLGSDDAMSRAGSAGDADEGGPTSPGKRQRRRRKPRGERTRDETRTSTSGDAGGADGTGAGDAPPRKRRRRGGKGRRKPAGDRKPLDTQSGGASASSGEGGGSGTSTSASGDGSSDSRKRRRRGKRGGRKSRRNRPNTGDDKRGGGDGGGSGEA